MKKYETIGLSVLVVKDNKIYYQNSFGYNPDYSDNTKRNPILPESIYWWASVSKTLISTSIMQLVEKGKISLDDDVNKYLDFPVRNPKYPEVPITIHMLLCHRSSLNDSDYNSGFDNLSQGNTKYARNFNQDKPGEKYSYCNKGYNLLAAIIEKATGLRFDKYVKKKIMKPLGLKGSFNKLTLDSCKFVKTYTYNQDEHTFEKYFSPQNRNFTKKDLKKYKLGISTPLFCPAGGMRTTVQEMAEIMLLHMNYGTYKNKKILSKKSEILMWTPKGSDSKYGYAFSHYDAIEGVDIIGMLGGSTGIHSAILFNPEEKYGFVVICNGCNSKLASGYDMNKQIVKILYKQFIE